MTVRIKLNPLPEDALMALSEAAFRNFDDEDLLREMHRRGVIVGSQLKFLLGQRTAIRNDQERARLAARKQAEGGKS